MNLITRRVMPSDKKAVKNAFSNLTGHIKDSGALALGDAGDRVSKLQERLRAVGAYDGPASGTFDDATAQAVQALQRQSKLPETGEVNLATLHALEKHYRYAKQALAPEAKQGQAGADIHRAEEMLDQLGYHVGQVDGVFDAQTERAVSAFRKDSDKVGDKGRSIDAQFMKALKQREASFAHDPYRRRVTADPAKKELR